jgi:tryptophan synthase beta chain
VPPTLVLHPGTMEPVTPDFLSVLFPMDLIMQEISTERYIEIPEEVREIYKLYRPTPLLRARRLEKALGTPAHIYYKNEGVSPAGSHKPNTAIPQAYYNKIAGTKALTTETGAGQWGSSLAFACSVFGLDLEIYMVKVSYQQKPYRRHLMETYGATVYASPTDRTNYGRSVLAENPNNQGSLGIAISEAVEVAATSNGSKKYSLGSVLNHVLLHQTVVGQEALKQMDMADEYPDVVIGCVGGGSNFAGIAYPFLRENLKNGKRTRLVGVEPTATPTLTKGRYTFDYGDTAKMAPIVKMFTLGHDFMPPGIHAGGLRYHGMAPSISALVDAGYIDAVAVKQRETFEAAVMFAKAEGIVPAPESAHAIRAAIDEALDAKAKDEKRVILFNLSGHGNFDMAAYESYLSGKLEDYEYPAEAVKESMSKLPQVKLPV